MSIGGDPVAVGDTYRLSCIGDWGAGTFGLITMHVKMISAGGTPAGFCAALKTNLLDLLKTKQSDRWYWRQINWISVNLTPAVSNVYSTGFPLQGTVVQEPLPATCAMIVTNRTSYAGRRYRGRQYIPGLPETESNGSTIDAAVVAAVQTYYDDLAAAYGLGGADPDYQLVVWSHTYSAGTPITEFVVRNTIGTQRRRRPGVGA